MITYNVKHQIPGRIRIEIPVLKKMATAELKGLAEVVTHVWKIEGIRNFSASPVSGNVTIKYDPAVIDIKAYLNEIAADREINDFIRKGVSDELH